MVIVGGLVGVCLGACGGGGGGGFEGVASIQKNPTIPELTIYVYIYIDQYMHIKR